MSQDRDQNGRIDSVGAAIEYCFEALEASDVFYGHGTDNAWDEAVQLVLSAAQLPADADDRVLGRPLADAQRQTMMSLLRRRIEEHVPATLPDRQGLVCGYRVQL